MFVVKIRYFLHNKINGFRNRTEVSPQGETCYKFKQQSNFQ